MAVKFNRLSQAQKTFITQRLDAAGAPVDTNRPRSAKMRQLNADLAKRSDNDALSYGEARQAIGDFVRRGSPTLFVPERELRATLASDDGARNRLFAHAFPEDIPAGQRLVVGKIRRQIATEIYHVQVQQRRVEDNRVVLEREVMVDERGEVYVEPPESKQHQEVLRWFRATYAYYNMR
jgi:hypothetical protein